MHRVTGRRTIHDARRIVALRQLTMLAVIACLGLAATPLAGQEVLSQGSVQRSQPTSASPIDPVSLPRTPIRRANEAAERHADEAGAGSLWGTIITLALILGGLYLVLRLFKRLSPATSAASQRAGLIDVIATRRLDAQSVVHLVRIGPRVLAVGASPAGLSTLGTFDDPAEMDALLGTSERSDARGSLFPGSRPIRGVGTPSAQPRAEASAVSAPLSHAGPRRSA
jgi:flagellar biogenesis protein FliO